MLVGTVILGGTDMVGGMGGGLLFCRLDVAKDTTAGTNPGPFSAPASFFLICYRRCREVVWCVVKEGETERER